MYLDFKVIVLMDVIGMFIRMVEVMFKNIGEWVGVEIV